jgi:DNA-binding transcriptional LysR family regulator
LGQHVVAELLPRFMKAYPKVQVVARLTSGVADLFEEGLDLELRVHAKPLADSNLVQRDVCRIQLILVASPGYLDTTGRPRDPQDLERAGGLARDIHLEEAVWNLEHESGRRAVVAYRPLLASNDWLTLRKVATAGIGITAVPAHVCRNELASGALERVLPGPRPSEGRKRRSGRG